jgi:hypothetical protein
MGANLYLENSRPSVCTLSPCILPHGILKVFSRPLSECGGIHGSKFVLGILKALNLQCVM